MATPYGQSTANFDVEGLYEADVVAHAAEFQPGDTKHPRSI